jgi:hypothetical protein
VVQQPLPVAEGQRHREPTGPEQRAHDLTHVPYAAWCRICVASKGRDRSH